MYTGIFILAMACTEYVLEYWINIVVHEINCFNDGVCFWNNYYLLVSKNISTIVILKLSATDHYLNSRNLFVYHDSTIYSDGSYTWKDCMLLDFFTKEATVNGIYLGTESQRTVVMKPGVGYMSISNWRKIPCQSHHLLSLSKRESFHYVWFGQDSQRVSSLKSS